MFKGGLEPHQWPCLSSALPQELRLRIEASSTGGWPSSYAAEAQATLQAERDLHGVYRSHQLGHRDELAGCEPTPDLGLLRQVLCPLRPDTSALLERATIGNVFLRRKGMQASMITRALRRSCSVQCAEELDPVRSRRAVREYPAVLDDAAFGAATSVAPKYNGLVGGSIPPGPTTHSRETRASRRAAATRRRTWSTDEPPSTSPFCLATLRCNSMQSRVQAVRTRANRSRGECSMEQSRWSSPSQSA